MILSDDFPEQSKYIEGREDAEKRYQAIKEEFKSIEGFQQKPRLFSAMENLKKLFQKGISLKKELFEEICVRPQASFNMLE